MGSNWIYYNHAIIPGCAPHELPDMKLLNDGSIWKNLEKTGGIPLLARWISDFDCIRETGFWACILDKPFDLSTLKAKRRYEINKGNRFFKTKVLNGNDLDKMHSVYVESLLGYAEEKKPVDKETFHRQWKKAMEDPRVTVVGVDKIDDSSLCGFCHCINYGKYIPISSFKTKVGEEKHNVNFALMNGVCKFFEEDLQNGGYLCDGWRNAIHETAFQEWLEKYFQFRKAYCVLHLKFRFPLNVIIRLIYPVRGLFKKNKKVFAILTMEEWRRQCR